MKNSVDSESVGDIASVAYSAPLICNDSGDSLSDSNPAESFSPSTPTIQDVYMDVDQSKLGVATVVDGIRNERLKAFEMRD